MCCRIVYEWTNDKRQHNGDTDQKIHFDSFQPFHFIQFYSFTFNSTDNKQWNKWSVSFFVVVVIVILFCFGSFYFFQTYFQSLFFFFFFSLVSHGSNQNPESWYGRFIRFFNQLTIKRHEKSVYTLSLSISHSHWRYTRYIDKQNKKKVSLVFYHYISWDDNFNLFFACNLFSSCCLFLLLVKKKNLLCKKMFFFLLSILIYTINIVVDQW